jgi:hypothetical protein
MRIAGPRVPILAQVIAALILAAATELALVRAGPVATAVALYALLAVACFALLALARALVASRRVRMGGLGPGRGGGGPWRGRDGGVREPRRPRGPYMPPAAAAAVPERDDDARTGASARAPGPLVLPRPARRGWRPQNPLM